LKFVTDFLLNGIKSIIRVSEEIQNAAANFLLTLKEYLVFIYRSEYRSNKHDKKSTVDLLTLEHLNNL